MQLPSHERRHLDRDPEDHPGNASGGRYWFVGRERQNQRQFLRYFKTRLAHELRDAGGVEARRVVLDAEGTGGVIEGEAADAVDLFSTGQREGHGLSGWGGVRIKDFRLGHRRMIARCETWNGLWDAVPRVTRS